jgi:cyclic-di-GMP phosphodiesterase TipF (flagellum assembly factor)
MLRLGAIFIVVCIILIAGSVGAALYLAAGLSAAEAAVVALIVLSGLALHNAVTTRLRDRSDLGGQIADMSRGSADLARQVGELSRRVAALEARSEASAERLHAATAPLAAEIEELGALLRQLAESVAAHDAVLAHGGAPAPAAAAAAPAAEAEPEPEPAPALAAAPTGDELIATIRSAIDANRIDLYLQPIVTLPQRKVRYYEALTRLRTEDGQTLSPAEFLAPAEAAGLIARIDHMLLFRCVQVLRRLQQKNRDVGLFCNLSSVTLNDPQFFPQMAQFLEANRALAPSLVLEFRQTTWRAMGPLELESLGALREVGFRFSMDHVDNLSLEPRDLTERGIRFVKAPATLLLADTAAGRNDIHVADLAGMLVRFGVNLIADRIEQEAQVVDLLDYEVKFGQGFLFSPPRPVRAEALQAVGDAKEPPARDAPGAGRPPGMAATAPSATAL